MDSYSTQKKADSHKKEEDWTSGLKEPIPMLRSQGNKIKYTKSDILRGKRKWILPTTL